MKAAVLEEKNRIAVRSWPDPEPGPGEVRVRVRYSGVCGSDFPRVLRDAAHYYPIILGHEFAGVVDTVGEGVGALNPGDPVACAPLLPCHQCELCQRGLYAQCRALSFIGSRKPGGWAEYVVMPEKNAVPLSEGVDLLSGAFLEPATVALHGLSLMEFTPGRDTAIIGMGTIGLLTLQCARNLGAGRIFVFDIDEERLKTAASLGADVCLNSADAGCLPELMDRTDGLGCDMVLETAGVGAAEKLALQAAAPHGRVMYIGTPSKPNTLEPAVFELMNRKELTVQGSWMSYSAPFPGWEWGTAADWLSRGRIAVQPLIDRVIPMEELPQAFADIEAGKVKGKILLEV